MDRRYVSGAGALGHADAGIGDLSGPGFPAQLSHCLVEHAYA